jgi:hypothetical protein
MWEKVSAYLMPRSRAIRTQGDDDSVGKGRKSEVQMDLLET